MIRDIGISLALRLAWQVLFAAILGYFILSQIPDALSFAGYAIIIAAAIGNYLYRLNRAKHEISPPEKEDGERSDAQDCEKKEDEGG